MSDELFPVVGLAKDLFAGYAHEICGPNGSEIHYRFPRARERALQRVLSQRCIVAGEVPASPEHLSLRPRRWHGEGGKNTPHRLLKNIDTWEDHLGHVFGTTIVRQGQPVLSALRPAFQSNHIVFVVDPYLAFANYNKSQDRYVLEPAGLKMLLNASSNLRVVQGVGKFRDHRDDGNMAAERIARWLLKNDSGKSVTLFLYEPFDERSRQKPALHDRFMGFAESLETDSSWHAVSLGYGLAALTDGNGTETCLARITSSHFQTTWNRARSYCTWAVVYDEYYQALGGGWTEASSFGDGPKRAVVLRRASSGQSSARPRQGPGGWSQSGVTRRS